MPPNLTTKVLALALVGFIAAGTLGCATGPVNPSLPITSADAEADIRRMRDEPRTLDRPVVVLAGWADPFFANTYWRDTLRKTGVERDRIVDLSFLGRWTLASCREKVLAEVEKAWPSDDPEWTREVDVVAFSMGGLVARASAAPARDDAQNPRRLRIARLYTIASPHRGSSLAALMPNGLSLDRRIIEMQPGSDTLMYLNDVRAAGDAAYELATYTRLNDWVIDSANTAPEGEAPWWVATPFLHRPHQEAYRDPRIEADILRRLRGESPLTTSPPAPLPD